MQVALYAVTRTHRTTGQLDLCIGSSPLSGKPYWASASAHTLHPILARSQQEADLYAGYAQRDDDKPQDYTYGTTQFLADLG